MNRRAIKTIATRDLKVVTRSKAVMIPMVVLPVMITVLFPAILGAAAPYLSEIPGSTTSEVALYLEQMPPQMKEIFAGYTETQTMIVMMVVYIFAPMFLILPLMIASTIAADSFAGEKERKTLEALIYTPTSDAELIAGKMLAAWIPALVITLGSFVVYGIVANVAAWPTMGEIFFPNFMWLVLVFWVAPAAAGLGLGTMVLVSSKVNTFQEAYQLGATVVLPVLILILGQATGLLYLSAGVIFLVGLILWLVDAAVLWFAVRTFRRSEIIARL